MYKKTPASKSCFETGETPLAVPLKLQSKKLPLTGSINPYAFTQHIREALLIQLALFSGCRLGSDRLIKSIIPIFTDHRLSEMRLFDLLRHRL